MEFMRCVWERKNVCQRERERERALQVCKAGTVAEQ